MCLEASLIGLRCWLLPWGTLKLRRRLRTRHCSSLYNVCSSHRLSLRALWCWHHCRLHVMHTNPQPEVTLLMDFQKDRRWPRPQDACGRTKYLSCENLCCAVAMLLHRQPEGAARMGHAYLPGSHMQPPLLRLA